MHGVAPGCLIRVGFKSLPSGKITASRDGGTGRRSGLKIRRPSGLGGSTPPPGTSYNPSSSFVCRWPHKTDLWSPYQYLRETGRNCPTRDRIFSARLAFRLHQLWSDPRDSLYLRNSPVTCRTSTGARPNRTGSECVELRVWICITRRWRSPVQNVRRPALPATSSNRLRREEAQVQSQYERGLRQ